jgi:TonB family protein
MNRLQKKCIIASTGVHLLLGIMLLVGPGFFSRNSKPDNTPVLEFVAIATTDDNVSGGGDNTVKAPPALGVPQPDPPAAVAPPPPVPIVDRTPPPAAVVDRTPTPTPVKPQKADVVPDPVKRPHQIEVSTKPIVGPSTATDKAKKDAQAKAKAEADAKRRAAAALSRSIAGIQGGVAGSTEIKLGGPGGGGVPYGNFNAAVKKRYWDAWHPPAGVPNLTVSATVDIGRDGTVLSARITDPSGNAAVDSSVQETLDNVKFAAPLPTSATENHRFVPLRFNTDAKLSE